MPLISAYFWSTVAHAGTAVWLTGTPDPSLTSADKARTAAELAPAPTWSVTDDAAVQALQSELSGCVALLDAFDGELAILRRLSGRLDTVTAVRPSDIDLLWQSLVLQGLAAHRYFPELSASEAEAAGVVRTYGGVPENAHWADAIALAPDRLPDVAELGDETARLAFQEQRARALLLDSATLSVQNVPEGAQVTVNGRSAPGGTLTVVPGTHWLQVAVDGRIHLRQVVSLAPGGEKSVPYIAVADELAAVAPSLRASRGAVVLPEPVVARLATFEAPVTLVIETPKGVRQFRVEGETAVAQVDAPVPSSSDRPHVWLAGALGWTYDGGYFVHNYAQGAPDALGTVNALSPVVGAGAQLPVGPLHVGLGADLAMPLGEWHSLPTDDATLRLRVHPHAAVGYGPVRATVGFWAPWHLGVGLRGGVPVSDSVEVTAAVVQGLGIAWERSGGGSFSPEASRVGWLGVAWRWPG